MVEPPFLKPITSLDNTVYNISAFFSKLPTVNGHKKIRLFCVDCGNMLIVESYCGDRLCFRCNKKRAKRLNSKYKSVIEGMKNPVLLTLTTKRCMLTRKNVSRIRRWFDRLRHKKIWRARGGLYNIEIGELDDMRMCNLHIHAIIDSVYMPQKKISEEWERISGSKIVDIRAVKIRKGLAIRYLIKHCVKIGKGLYEQKEYVNSVLHLTRLIQGFGEFLGCGISISCCMICMGTLISEFEPNFWNFVLSFRRDSMAG